MLRGIYSTASALTAVQQRQDVTAHNLAHMNVPGFRKLVAANSSFEEVFAGERKAIGGGTVARESGTDFTFGGFQDTGRPLDVAVNGDAFFSVSTPEGLRYTRSGSFYLQPDGQLTTADGYAVLDDGGGEIQLSANVTPSEIQIGRSGQIAVQGATVATLGLTAFEDNSKLQRSGTTLFTATEEAQIVDRPVHVEQGYRESSNVSSVDEMVQLILGMRQYEASQKVLTAIDDAIGMSTDPRSS